MKKILLLLLALLLAAGMLLITEAGGAVCNMDGGPVRCDMVEDVVAGNPAVVKLLTEKYF